VVVVVLSLYKKTPRICEVALRQEICANCNTEKTDSLRRCERLISKDDPAKAQEGNEERHGDPGVVGLCVFRT